MSSKIRKELSNLLRAIEDYHENAIEYVGKTIMDFFGKHINAAYIEEVEWYLDQNVDCFIVSSGPWTIEYDNRNESEVKE